MSNIQDDVVLLRSIPIFAQLSAPKLKLLAFASRRMQYKAGQYFFRQGDPADAAYVVIDGKIEIIVESDSVDTVVVERGKNDIFGEMAVLSDSLRTATVRAKTPVNCLRIQKEHFMTIITDTPSLMMDVIKILASRLEKATRELSAARTNEVNRDAD